MPRVEDADAGEVFQEISQTFSDVRESFGEIDGAVYYGNERAPIALGKSERNLERARSIP